jgi:hypothetical protein
MLPATGLLFSASAAATARMRPPGTNSMLRGALGAGILGSAVDCGRLLLRHRQEMGGVDGALQLFEFRQHLDPDLDL